MQLNQEFKACPMHSHQHNFKTQQLDLQFDFKGEKSLCCLKIPPIQHGRKLQRDLALLWVVLSVRSWTHLLWGWRDEEETWVALWCLFVVVSVTPLSLPHRCSLVIGMGGLVLWPCWLVAKSASKAILISRRTVAASSSSAVTPSMSSSVSGANAWHIGSFRQHL